MPTLISLTIISGSWALYWLLRPRQVSLEDLGRLKEVLREEMQR